MHNSREETLSEYVEQGLLRLRTNERSSWMYKVKRALTNGQFSRWISKCPENSIKDAGLWVSKVSEIAVKLLQPSSNGFHGEWKQTMEIALEKGSKEKSAIESVGIEALAMFAVHQYLAGKKKLPADETINKKSWNHYVELVCQDRANFEQNEGNPTENEDQEFENSSIGDPDELYRETVKRNKLQPIQEEETPADAEDRAEDRAESADRE